MVASLVSRVRFTGIVVLALLIALCCMIVPATAQAQDYETVELEGLLVSVPEGSWFDGSDNSWNINTDDGVFLFFNCLPFNEEEMDAFSPYDDAESWESLSYLFAEEGEEPELIGTEVFSNKSVDVIGTFSFSSIYEVLQCYALVRGDGCMWMAVLMVSDKDDLDDSLAMARLVLGSMEAKDADNSKKDVAKQSPQASPASSIVEESRSNINPYLKYLGTFTDDGVTSISSDLYEGRKSVELMGRTGSIGYDVNDDTLICEEFRWFSNDFYTFDEHQDFAEDLSEYFGSEPRVELEQIGQWNYYTYYWTDKNVPCSVKFYASVRANHEDDADRLEVYWEVTDETPVDSQAAMDAEIESIESLGADFYGNHNSVSEIQSLINDYYDLMTDDQKRLVLEALGVAKVKDAVIEEVKYGLKSPSSFELESYDSFYFYVEEDGYYSVYPDITYSGTNSFGARLSDSPDMVSAEFKIDLENGTATVTEVDVWSM